MPESIHFLNGKFVGEKELTVSVRDLGFSRGYAVFDFFITYLSQRPFMLSKHIERLFNSANLIGLPILWSRDEIKTWVMQVLDANKSSDEKQIKIIISGGVSDSLLPLPNATTIAIVVDPRHYLPANLYEKGAGIIMDKHTRYVPGAKTNNYIEGVKEAQLAQKINAIEAVYYDDAQVFEGSSSNIFALINGKLLTPKSNVLPGITREVLLEVFKLDVAVELVDFGLAELMAATEVFLTGSNKEVLPITKIDGKNVGDGKVGVITQEAMRQFKEFTLSDRWS
jgi:branched-chain amino acid aminotransferase